jgi:hypothetical protein
MSPKPVPFFRVHAWTLEACREIRIKDGALFDFDVNERTLTQRLALYLQKYFPYYKVDCEYNREVENKKRLPIIKVESVMTDDIRARTVFPDIVIHDRGNHVHNLLVIEAKVHMPRGTRSENDWAKLIGFTDPQGIYKYQWGAFIHATGKDSPADFDVKWFRHGRELSNSDVNDLIEESLKEAKIED